MQKNIIFCAAGWNKCWNPVEENLNYEQRMWCTFYVINWKAKDSDRTEWLEWKPVHSNTKIPLTARKSLYIKPRRRDTLNNIQGLSHVICCYSVVYCRHLASSWGGTLSAVCLLGLLNYKGYLASCGAEGWSWMTRKRKLFPCFKAFFVLKGSAADATSLEA
jgi:hypothetical protein